MDAVGKTIELVDCKDSAAHVLLHPDIVSDIAEDGVSWDELPDGPVYLTGFVGSEIIGCFVIDKRSSVSADVHVQVLPEYRAQFAESFGHAVLNWTWSNTDFTKLTAEIDTDHANVLAFAESMGFEIEGVNTKSIQKGGRILDQWYVGIVKPE